MKLKYETTRLAIIRGTLRATPWNRGLMWYLAVMITVVLGLSIRDNMSQGRAPAVIIIASIFTLIVVGVLMAFGLTVVTLLGLHFGKGKGVLGEHELIISDEGLTEKTEYNENLHRWIGLGEVRETSAFYFVRTMEGGGAFHLIPKTSHIVEGDPHAFVVELRKRKLQSLSRRT